MSCYVENKGPGFRQFIIQKTNADISVKTRIDGLYLSYVNYGKNNSIYTVMKV